MSQTTELLDTLKQYLKAKNITYRRLAQEIGLSETSIKRLFSEESFSLRRLEEVCKILDLDIYDLSLMARRKRQRSTNSLSIEQERILVGDERLLTFLYFLINGWPLSLITEQYDITEQEATRLLIKLDRLKLIELYPENRFRLLVSKNIFWRKHGPLWKHYQKKVFEDFIRHPFDQPNDRLEFSPGQLSEASLRLILKKIDELVRQFNELAEMDADLPLKGRYSTGLVIGFRPWVFSMIADLRRSGKKPTATLLG